MHRYVLVGMLVAGQGCAATIEQLPQTTGPAASVAGRAFFLQRDATSSNVLVCDVRIAAVYCYASNSQPGVTP